MVFRTVRQRLLVVGERMRDTAEGALIGICRRRRSIDPVLTIADRDILGGLERDEAGGGGASRDRGSDEVGRALRDANAHSIIYYYVLDDVSE